MDYLLALRGIEVGRRGRERRRLRKMQKQLEKKQRQLEKMKKRKARAAVRSQYRMSVRGAYRSGRGSWASRMLRTSSRPVGKSSSGGASFGR